jgi:hypothetical protein
LLSFDTLRVRNRVGQRTRAHSIRLEMVLVLSNKGRISQNRLKSEMLSQTQVAKKTQPLL